MNGSGEALLTWLHISDLHAGHGPVEHSWDQELVLRKMCESVREGCRKDRWPPIELMLVTGDIAFSGGGRPGKDGEPNDEYKRAQGWLTRLASAAGISAKAVFVVPGNHDVDWSRDNDRNTRRLISSLRNGDDPIDDALADSGDRQQLAARQARFLEFAEQWAEPCRGRKLFWSHRATTARGLPYRLAGLNTALLCAGDEDRGVLAVGKEQLAKMLAEESADSDELVIVLGHHPLTGDWLADEKQCRDHLLGCAHLYLCGHLHQAHSSWSQAASGQEIVLVQAGAAHAEAKPKGLVAPATHGFNVTSVVRRSDGSMAIEVRPWQWDTNRFVVATGSTRTGDDYATHPLNLAPEPKPHPAAPDESPGDDEEPVRQEIRDDLRRILAEDSDLARSLAGEYGTSDPGRLAAQISAAPLPDSLGRLFAVYDASGRHGAPASGSGFREMIAVLLRLATEWDTVCRWRESLGNGSTRHFRLRPFKKRYLAQIASRLIQRSRRMGLARGHAAPEAGDVIEVGLDPGTDLEYSQAQIESLLWERAMHSTPERYRPEEDRDELLGNLSALADQRRGLVVLVDAERPCVRPDIVQAIPSVLLFERCQDGEACFVIDEFELGRLLNDTLYPEGG